LEDNVFRFAKYESELRKGQSQTGAAQAAADAFLDYDINAPWVNLARRTAFPFMAFTYRAIPKLNEMVEKKPWKLMKLAATVGALNAAGYALSGGDEERERAWLPEERQGNIWGMMPRAIRMPWNDKEGNPIFLDINRFIPMGDLFQWQQTNSAIPILPMMVPGGPLEMLAEFLANKDSFTGKPITLESDTGLEKASKTVGHIYQGLAPNFAAFPGSYQYDKIFPTLPEAAQEGLRAVGLGADTAQVDPFGREYPALLAVANALGLKIAAYPQDLGEYRMMRQADAQLREIQQQMGALGYKFGNKGVSEKQFNSRMEDLARKQQAIVDNVNERLQKARGIK
jgi:hypothetical protein